MFLSPTWVLVLQALRVREIVRFFWLWTPASALEREDWDTHPGEPQVMMRCRLDPTRTAVNNEQDMPSKREAARLKTRHSSACVHPLCSIITIELGSISSVVGRGYIWDCLHSLFAGCSRDILR